ncbi:DUF1850 domain-containing protein [Pelagibacterium sp.]|uniref:DUF1850 domain-containing protein n=1 Tax=Pelagibacterium sp. TaxID=1967288 RepID=UPI003A952E7A
MPVRKGKSKISGGASLLLALSLSGAPLASENLRLDVVDEDGATVFHEPVTEGAQWCVFWNHSVQHFLVRDCFAALDGNMVLERSHQPDFAAGLGHIPGRGTMTSAPDGGYWIEGINEAVPKNCLRLRVGAPGVDHRIVVNGRDFNLSAIAPRKAVRIVLRPAGQEGEQSC